MGPVAPLPLLLALLTLCWPAAPLHAAGQVLVTTQPLESLASPQAIDAPASVVSLRHATLGVEVPGTVAAVLAEVGERVEQGAPLLRLDPWEYRLRVTQERAGLDSLQLQLAFARSQLQRTRTLQRQQQASAELLEQRENTVRSLEVQVQRQQAALETARQQLARTTLTAPYEGVIASRQAQPGGWAAPGQPLFTLVDTATLELSAQLGPEAADGLTSGQAWRFVHPGGSHPVQPRVVLPVADPMARTREARLTFTGTPLPPPGASGRLTWRSGLPSVPAWLMVRRGEALGVFLARDGKAVFLPLPNAQEGRSAPLGGTARGQVIISGREGLVDGQPIRVMPATPSQ